MRSRVAAAIAAVALLPLSASSLGSPASAAPAPPAIPDTVGTDFWVAFPTNPIGPTDQKLFLSPTEDGQVTVSDRLGNVLETRDLEAGVITEVSVATSRQIEATDGLDDDTLRLESTAPMSVYGAAVLNSASTGFQAFPDDALGTSYRVLAYTSLPGWADAASRLTVLATDDDTTITVTPATAVGGRAAGTPYTVVLDTGQAYQLASNGSGQDVTGTTVTSDKPVGVLGGAGCTNVPSTAFACNPLLQQLPPTSAWGTSFVSGRLAKRAKGDTYRVLAHVDDTVVSVDGDQVATLGAGEFYEAVLPDVSAPGNGGVAFTTSRPALVAQYSNGTSFDNTNGDPMMILVPPTEQQLRSYVVVAPDVAMEPWINVVARAQDVGSVILDGEPIAAGEFVEVGETGFVVAQLQVGVGQHAISSPGRLGVQVYLLGDADGLGFPAGSALAAVADAPPAPVAGPVSSTGTGVQSVTIPLGAGVTITLVDGTTETDEVTVPGEGTYRLDATAGTITFTPAPGFTGAATAVTYRLRDAYNQDADGTYRATVASATTPTTPATPPADTRAVLRLAKRVVVADGRDTVRTDCVVRGGDPGRCAVRLLARVDGERVLAGRGVARQAAGRTASRLRVQVELNAVGRSLVARPGGVRLRAELTVRVRQAGTLRDKAVTRVVARTVVVEPPVYFAPGSTRLTARAQAYLRGVGRSIGNARAVVCAGYADNQGPSEWNRRISRQRAEAVCSALALPSSVAAQVLAHGEANPLAPNATSDGRARNRRVEVTIRY